MPKAPTTIRIEISDAVRQEVGRREPNSERSLKILHDLALDFLVNTADWSGDVDRRCEMLARDGSSAEVAIRIDIDPVHEGRATILWYECANIPLTELVVPFVHVNEFYHDYAATEYNSKPISDRPVLNVRLGSVRRTQPMRFDIADVDNG